MQMPIQTNFTRNVNSNTICGHIIYLSQIADAQYEANRIQYVWLSSAIETGNRCEFFIKTIDFGSFTIRFKTIQNQLFYIHFRRLSTSPFNFGKYFFRLFFSIFLYRWSNAQINWETKKKCCKVKKKVRARPLSMLFICLCIESVWENFKNEDGRFDISIRLCCYVHWGAFTVVTVNHFNCKSAYLLL